MKDIVCVLTALDIMAAPALAAQGGLPGLQQQIDTLQAQVSAMAAGDGTAEAIVGTWTGEHNSLVADSLTKVPSPGQVTTEAFFHVFGHVDGGLDVGLGPGHFDTLEPFFHIQIIGPSNCCWQATPGLRGIFACFVAL